MRTYLAIVAAALAMSATPPAAPPMAPTVPGGISVSPGDTAPVVIARTNYVATIYPDRVEILYAGRSRPTTLLLETDTVPLPDPAPTPGPVPTPTPTPSPTPSPQYDGPVRVSIALPDPPPVAMAAIQTSATWRQALAARNADCRVYIGKVNDAWDAVIAASGGPPLVYFTEPTTGKEIRPPVRFTTEADLIAILKEIRGK